MLADCGDAYQKINMRSSVLTVDEINPSYYKDADIECIDAIRASMTPEAFRGYLKGSVQKYVWRYEDKNVDRRAVALFKAKWFLEQLIEDVERERIS